MLRERVIWIGYKGGQFIIREGVWEELMVSVETEEETEELVLVELEDRVTGESRMETGEQENR